MQGLNRKNPSRTFFLVEKIKGGIQWLEIKMSESIHIYFYKEILKSNKKIVKQNDVRKKTVENLMTFLYSNFERLHFPFNGIYLKM